MEELVLWGFHSSNTEMMKKLVLWDFHSSNTGMMKKIILCRFHSSKTGKMEKLVLWGFHSLNAGMTEDLVHWVLHPSSAGMMNKLVLWGVCSLFKHRNDEETSTLKCLLRPQTTPERQKLISLSRIHSLKTGPRRENSLSERWTEEKKINSLDTGPRRENSLSEHWIEERKFTLNTGPRRENSLSEHWIEERNCTLWTLDWREKNSLSGHWTEERKFTLNTGPRRENSLWTLDQGEKIHSLNTGSRRETALSERWTEKKKFTLWTPDRGEKVTLWRSPQSSLGSFLEHNAKHLDRSRRAPRRLPRDTNQSLVVAANDNLLAQTTTRWHVQPRLFCLSRSCTLTAVDSVIHLAVCFHGARTTWDTWTCAMAVEIRESWRLPHWPCVLPFLQWWSREKRPVLDTDFKQVPQQPVADLWRLPLERDRRREGGRGEGGGTWERRGVVAVEVGAAVAVKYTPVTKTVLLGSEPVYLLGLRQSLRTHFPHSTSPSFCQGRQPNHPGWTCVGWVDKNPWYVSNLSCEITFNQTACP